VGVSRQFGRQGRMVRHMLLQTPAHHPSTTPGTFVADP
jgi:hypothetical protein